MSKLITVMFMGLLISCAYQPKGMVSKVDADIYKVEYTDNSEKDVKKVLHADAKGICKSDHKKKYFQVIEEKYVNTGMKLDKKEGEGGFMSGLKSASNMLLDDGQENNWNGEIQFKCQ